MTLCRIVGHSKRLYAMSASEIEIYCLKDVCKCHCSSLTAIASPGDSIGEPSSL